MADTISKEKRSQIMSKVKSKNTQLELSFRKKLWNKWPNYRLHYKVAGKPDLVFVSKRIAIFIDSCFWHKCPLHHREPKSNKKYWIPKLKRNELRAKEVNKSLTKRGWKVIRIWEHEIKDNQNKSIKKITRYLK
ncbi:MAG: very short patch repair endonuclease [Patescibacteria group bacterium]